MFEPPLPLRLIRNPRLSGTLKSRKPPFIKVAIFSHVILVSNYHGCKGEAINLLRHYLIDIINKTVKTLHLENVQIIQNIKKLMLQVIFIFSDWILNQMKVPSTAFVLGQKQIFKKFYLEFWLGNWGMSKNS